MNAIREAQISIEKLTKICFLIAEYEVKMISPNDPRRKLINEIKSIIVDIEER